ncbi:MAG: FKBP-type peptidyl-prolyl cis-trans isomerase [Mucilaginibacter polytrichastri]|nr:FKBP-type peptidyl-prolyl cis-trans isomerase [Mucilaginibacter polytrichastri]
MNIEPQKVVSLTYKLFVDRGQGEELVEETTTENPLVFLYGAGNMLPKFEENLAGLKPADPYDFRLSADEGYGPYDDTRVANLPKEMFEGELPKIGASLPLRDQEGNTYQSRVLLIGEDAVVADLNHPMAGHDLHFTGEIVDVRAASDEEMAHGHVHGPGGHHH